jgi:hypothetical protein
MIILKELDRREVGSSGNKVRFALFECEHCKTEVVRQKHNGLRDLSCGCIRYELSSKAITKHGDSNKKSKYKNLFGIWARMRDRCNRKTNEDYKYYGGKGIIVESIWDDYLEFKKWSLLNGYEPNKNLQIDRIDGNKNYCPENCRWVSPTINQRNRDCVILNTEKANEIRVLLTKDISISEIANMYGVHPDTIKDIKKGKTWQH